MTGVARPSPARLTPNWPDAPSDDVAAEAVRQLALRLTALTSGQSARQVGARCGVNHAVITRILRGDTWPDARSIRLLEAGLKSSLWPAWLEDGADDAFSGVLDPVGGGDRPEEAGNRVGPS